MIFIFISCGKKDTESANNNVATDLSKINDQNNPKKLIVKFSSSSQQKYIWNDNYTTTILSQLDDSDLSSILEMDLDDFDLKLLKCNGYENATREERKNFFVLYLASIAHAESRLNPNTTYREKDGTLSTGLLQIDVASANRHASIYTGNKYDQRDMFNAEMNLISGLYILKHQLDGGLNNERKDVQSRLLTDKSYYWSVLTLKKELIIKTFVENSLKNLPFCQE